MLALSIADVEKLFVNADSSPIDLNTQFPAPVIATLIQVFNLSTYTPTITFSYPHLTLPTKLERQIPVCAHPIN